MKPKVIAVLFIFSALVLFAPTVVYAATEVGGLFSSDQHWVATGSPYVVLSGNTVSGVGMANGATLTIDPGVVVKFEAGAQLLTGTGKIKAIGTAEEPIVFTALNDDSAGGDTNEDGLSTSTPAFWHRIQPGNDEDEFQYTQVRYADFCLWVGFASPSIRNSTIENCNYGLEVQHTTSTIEIIDNTIRNNKTGLRFLVTAEGIKFSNNNIYDNSVLGAENLTPGKEIDASGNWWGDSSGPFHATQNPSGLGNAISDGFILSDFLSEAVATSTATTTATTTPETAEAEPAVDGPFGGTGSGYIPPQSVPPKIVNFFADPPGFKEGGGPVTLHWDTQSAEFARIEPGIGDVDLSGSVLVQPENPTTFTLTLLGPGGEASQGLFVDTAPRDPVIIVPGILGSFNGKLDPILNTYEGLINGLKSVGYVEGKNLFRLPYEWWNDNRFTAVLLGKKVNEVLEICSCDKVDIVAHSMGGLVARYYLQNIDDQHVDQLIFIGTPHLGAPKAYLAWEAGELGNEPSENIAEILLRLRASSLGYSSIVDYINQRVQSVQQLLPIFDYLSYYSAGKLLDYEECKNGLLVCNDFLEELSLTSLDDLASRSYNIINDTIPTPRAFIIKDKGDRFWIHGKPVNYPKDDGILKAAGDGTVPKISSEWGKDEYSSVASVHSKLPHYGQSEIINFLIGRKTEGLVGPEPYGKILFFRLGSPADLSVTDPKGNIFGAGIYDQGEAFYSGVEDPEFISIPNPIGGDYKISVIGTGFGEFEIETILLGEDIEESKIFQGTISAGQKYEFVFDYNSIIEKLGDLELRDIDPPETKLLIDGKKVSFQATDDSKVEKTLYSLDSGNSWDEYRNPLFFDAGNYEILYHSIDEYGNQEYAKISNFSVKDGGIIAQNSESATIVEEDEDRAGLETNTTTGDVLGITLTERKDRNQRNSLVGTIALLLGTLIILIYLILRKQKI